MKKNFFFIVLLLFSTVIIFLISVKSEKSKSNKLVASTADEEMLEYVSPTETRMGEYSVRVIPTSDDTYGFLVLKNGKAVFHQDFNPFFITPEGFDYINNAFDTGWWVASELKKNHRPLQSDFTQALEMELNIQYRRR